MAGWSQKVRLNENSIVSCISTGFWGDSDAFIAKLKDTGRARMEMPLVRTAQLDPDGFHSA